MSSPDGARLLQRILEDPKFRARFRDDPVATAREAGFEPLAEQIEADGERALETLELRESRSSVAGVMFAAAIEGIGLFELSEHVLPHLRAGDALAAEPPQRTAPSGHVAAPPIDADDLTDGQSDDGDEDEPDEDEPDEDEPDEDEPDEDEPDEEEPDEEEPDDAEPDEQEHDDNEPDEPDDQEPDEQEPEDAGDSAGNGDADDDDGDDRDGSQGDDEDSPDGEDGDIDFPPIPEGYPGDSASQERIGLWMAQEAQKRGLPPELPVMASLVESGMENLPGGDADSVGFFQMRLGIWNRGEYAGYPERPELQLDWFLDHAEAVKAQRIARGSPTDPDHYGDWIADVERPAAQFRGRYQLRLAEAQALLRRALPDGDGVEELVDAGPGSTPHAGPRAREAVAEARRYLGTPYQWGGESPGTGFDCSGLVQWAYAKAGIRIPRVTEEQILAAGATKVGRHHLLPGDLVFFRDAGGDVHHVGMSLGGDRFIEAPRTGLKVRISSLNDPYYAQQFTGARRFDPPAPAVDARARVMPVLRADQIEPSSR